MKKARTIKELKQCSLEEIERIKSGEYYKKHKSVSDKTNKESKSKPDSNTIDNQFHNSDNDSKVRIKNNFDELKNCQYLRGTGFPSSD